MSPIFLTLLFYFGVDLDTLSDDDIVDADCVWEKGYELSQRDSTLDWGDDYDTRKRMMIFMILYCWDKLAKKYNNYYKNKSKKKHYFGEIRKYFHK